MLPDDEKIELSPFSIGVRKVGGKDVPTYSVRMNDNKEVLIGEFRGIAKLSVAAKKVNHTHLIFDSPPPPERF